LPGVCRRSLHDDAVDLLPLGVVRTRIIEAVLSELHGIDLALDQPARPEEPKPSEAARERAGLGGEGDLRYGWCSDRLSMKTAIVTKIARTTAVPASSAVRIVEAASRPDRNRTI
jgi:hypothetical protein